MSISLVEKNLFDAVKNSNQELLAEALNLGGNVNALDSHGMAPLHYADNVDIMLDLVNSGADTNLPSSTGKTALHYAVISGDQAMVDFLSSEPGIDVNVIDSFGMTPLDYAVLNRNMDVAVSLIKHNARLGNIFQLVEEEDKEVLYAAVSARSREKWKKSVDKFSHAVADSYDARIDTVRVGIRRYEPYLEEISIGTQTVNNKTYVISKMNEIEQYLSMLEFDHNTKKFNFVSGKIASTLNYSSKSEMDRLAFVMDKEGNFYCFEHAGTFNDSITLKTHASVLSGLPAEMTGTVTIHDGKITSITNNSGHYAPDPLDMYRGIKKLQELYPECIAPKATIQMYNNAIQDLGEYMSNLESQHNELRAFRQYQYMNEDLKAGIPAFVKDYKGSSLHKAIMSNCDPNFLAELIADKPNEINSQDQFGNTPVHLACLKSSNLVKVLLEAGANIDISNKYNIVPFLDTSSYAVDVQEVINQRLENILKQPDNLQASVQVAPAKVPSRVPSLSSLPSKNDVLFAPYEGKDAPGKATKKNWQEHVGKNSVKKPSAPYARHTQ